MSESGPSLLTQTQRERIRSEFADVEAAKRRRDQQKIRTRIDAGLDDFELLAEYPTEQLEMAVAERSKANLQARLADAYLTLERIREVHGIDRDAMIETAQEHKQSIPDDTMSMLGEQTFRTSQDWHQHTEAAIADQYRPSRWKRLSDAFLKLGFALILAVSLLAVVVPNFTQGPGSIIGIAGAVFLFCGLSILSVRGVKDDLFPIIRKFRTDPSATLQTIWNRF